MNNLNNSPLFSSQYIGLILEIVFLFMVLIVVLEVLLTYLEYKHSRGIRDYSSIIISSFGVCHSLPAIVSPRPTRKKQAKSVIKNNEDFLILWRAFFENSKAPYIRYRTKKSVLE
jgi:hypothetical protein